jgi:hypothetical protein
MTMGLFDGSMGFMSSMLRGTSAVSFWTGNMIYTALQNAHTKKEIKALYQHAADANFHNRAVALLPNLNKQQLLLTTGEPDDNDIYDYRTKSKTAALDYIWGQSEGVESLIISGGQNDERIKALIPFIYRVQTLSSPQSIIILHTGNQMLKNMLLKYCREVGFIDKNELYYDVFRGMPSDDIASLLYDTMPDGLASPIAETLLHALIEVLLRNDGFVTLHNLGKFPLNQLETTIDSMLKQGLFSPDEYSEIKSEYKAGASETASVSVFLNKLYKQAESVYGKQGNENSNIKAMLRRGSAIAIDVGKTGTDLLVSLVMNHLEALQLQGKKFSLVVDDISPARFPTLCNLLRTGSYAICNNDFISSLHGTQQGDDLFEELTGYVNTTVLFRHKSGTTCQRWSKHLGTYRKIRIKWGLAQNNSFMNSSNSRDLKVHEVDEPRIRAETLQALPNSVACIHSLDGILIASVTEPT